MEFFKNIAMVEWVFYFFAVLALCGALGTIMSKKPMHSVIALIITFFSLSGIYVLLNAQFLAVVNIIVYAGAIMVLFLFVIMFLNLRQESNELRNTPIILAATISGLVLVLMLVAVYRKAYFAPVNPVTFRAETGMIENLGTLLYRHYMLPFELVSVLFLVAISGAILIGKREKGGRHF
jgi:NADH-quinone oxidoreductase subunit J